MYTESMKMQKVILNSSQNGVDTKLPNYIAVKLSNFKVVENVYKSIRKTTVSKPFFNLRVNPIASVEASQKSILRYIRTS